MNQEKINYYQITRAYEKANGVNIYFKSKGSRTHKAKLSLDSNDKHSLIKCLSKFVYLSPKNRDELKPQQLKLLLIKVLYCYGLVKPECYDSNGKAIILNTDGNIEVDVTKLKGKKISVKGSVKSSLIVNGKHVNRRGFISRWAFAKERVNHSYVTFEYLNELNLRDIISYGNENEDSFKAAKIIFNPNNMIGRNDFEEKLEVGKNKMFNGFKNIEDKQNDDSYDSVIENCLKDPFIKTDKNGFPEMETLNKAKVEFSSQINNVIKVLKHFVPQFRELYVKIAKQDDRIAKQDDRIAKLEDKIAKLDDMEFREKARNNFWKTVDAHPNYDLKEIVSVYEERCKSKYEGNKLEMALAVSDEMKKLFALLRNNNKEVGKENENLSPMEKELTEENERLKKEISKLKKENDWG